MKITFTFECTKSPSRLKYEADIAKAWAKADKSRLPAINKQIAQTVLAEKLFKAAQTMDSSAFALYYASETIAEKLGSGATTDPEEVWTAFLDRQILEEGGE
jgi:hypothetical protein